MYIQRHKCTKLCEMYKKMYPAWMLTHWYFLIAQELSARVQCLLRACKCTKCIQIQHLQTVILSYCRHVFCTSLLGAVLVVQSAGRNDLQWFGVDQYLTDGAPVALWVSVCWRESESLSRIKLSPSLLPPPPQVWGDIIDSFVQPLPVGCCDAAAPADHCETWPIP